MTQIVITYTETNDEIMSGKQNIESRLRRAMVKAKRWVSSYDIERVKDVIKELFRDNKPVVKALFEF